MNVNKLADFILSSYASRAKQTEQARLHSSPDTEKGAGSRVSGGQDDVSLSAGARQLARIADEVSANSDAREVKIGSLHDSVQSGTYQVSAESLAKKLIELRYI